MVTYYKCAEPGCNVRSRTEKAAIAHYHTHFIGGGTSIVPRRSMPSIPSVRRSMPSVRYKSRFANAIDRGGAKIRRGFETLDEVSSAVNNNFNFAAAIDNASSDYDFGSALTGGLMGEEPRRRRR